MQSLSNCTNPVVPPPQALSLINSVKASAVGPLSSMSEAYQYGVCLM